MLDSYTVTFPVGKTYTCYPLTQDTIITIEHLSRLLTLHPVPSILNEPETGVHDLLMSLCSCFRG